MPVCVKVSKLFSRADIYFGCHFLQAQIWCKEFGNNVLNPRIGTWEGQPGSEALSTLQGDLQTGLWRKAFAREDRRQEVAWVPQRRVSRSWSRLLFCQLAQLWLENTSVSCTDSWRCHSLQVPFDLLVPPCLEEPGSLSSYLGDGVLLGGGDCYIRIIVGFSTGRLPTHPNHPLHTNGCLSLRDVPWWEGSLVNWVWPVTHSEQDCKIQIQ